MILLAMIAPVHLSHHGKDYLVKIVPTAERPLEVWRNNRRITFGLLTRYHPWKLQIVDVDGRGQAIAVGVNKPTHNLPFPHRTLFLYSFNGQELKRKWTGSTMGRPLLDFCFAPGIPQRLITLEKCMDGKVAISGYKWAGFGFQKLSQESCYGNAAKMLPKAAGLSLFADGHDVLLPWNRILL